MHQEKPIKPTPEELQRQFEANQAPAVPLNESESNPYKPDETTPDGINEAALQELDDISLVLLQQVNRAHIRNVRTETGHLAEESKLVTRLAVEVLTRLDILQRESGEAIIRALTNVDDCLAYFDRLTPGFMQFEEMVGSCEIMEQSTDVLNETAKKQRVAKLRAAHLCNFIETAGKIAEKMDAPNFKGHRRDHMRAVSRALREDYNNMEKNVPVLYELTENTLDNEDREAFRDRLAESLKTFRAVSNNLLINAI